MLLSSHITLAASQVLLLGAVGINKSKLTNSCGASAASQQPQLRHTHYPWVVSQAGSDDEYTQPINEAQAFLVVVCPPLA